MESSSAFLRPTIEVRSITKSYAVGKQLHSVLESISCSVQPGEVLVILGASGSGKSTLLRLLSGLENYDQGQIVSDFLRPGPQVSYLPQAEALLPWRTVKQNIELAYTLRSIKGTVAIDDEVNELMSRVGIERYAQSLPQRLSGGMQQRVLLARALAAGPALLLLDEPFSQLDILARQQLSLVIRNSVQATGAAAVVVTHSLEEAFSLADRILVISRSPASIVSRFGIKGRVEFIAEGEALISDTDDYHVLKESLLATLRVSEDHAI